MLPYLRFVCIFVDPTHCRHVACVCLHVVLILPTLHLRSSSDCLHVVYSLTTDFLRSTFILFTNFLQIIPDICFVLYECIYVYLKMFVMSDTCMQKYCWGIILWSLLMLRMPFSSNCCSSLPQQVLLQSCLLAKATLITFWEAVTDVDFQWQLFPAWFNGSNPGRGPHWSWNGSASEVGSAQECSREGYCGWGE